MLEIRQQNESKLCLTSDYNIRQRHSPVKDKDPWMSVGISLGLLLHCGLLILPIPSVLSFNPGNECYPFSVPPAFELGIEPDVDDHLGKINTYDPGS